MDEPVLRARRRQSIFVPAALEGTLDDLLLLRLAYPVLQFLVSQILRIGPKSSYNLVPLLG